MKWVKCNRRKRRREREREKERKKERKKEREREREMCWINQIWNGKQKLPESRVET